MCCTTSTQKPHLHTHNHTHIREQFLSSVKATSEKLKTENRIYEALSNELQPLETIFYTRFISTVFFSLFSLHAVPECVFVCVYNFHLFLFLHNFLFGNVQRAPICTLLMLQCTQRTRKGSKRVGERVRREECWVTHAPTHAFFFARGP